MRWGKSNLWRRESKWKGPEAGKDLTICRKRKDTPMAGAW